VKGRFEVHLLDSDHDSMMEEPAVQELAAKLRQTIDRVIPHTDAADA
jgi:thioesterase domain-containing protein